MKKITLLFFSLVGFSVADSWLDPAYGLWGVGAISRDRNYKGVGVDFAPGVFIFGGFGPVFIEANRFGYSFYQDGTYFASIAAQIRSHQYRTREDNLFGERKRAIEAGVQLGRRLPAGLITRLAFLHDISGAHKSWEFDWQIYRRNVFDTFRLLTALGLQYQNKKLVDYYYGTEVYSPKEALIGELEIIVTIPVGNFSIFAGTRIYIFNNEVAKSPVSDSYRIDQFFSGVGYNF